MKSATRVVDEIARIKETGKIDMFYFVDNTFNVPRSHAESICNELVRRKMNIQWFTDTILPLGMTDDFCHLIKEAGCAMAFLAVESGSAKMLKNMNRGLYGPKDIRESAINLNRAHLPFGIGLLLGGPGETEETISETLDLIDSLPEAQLIHVTIGIGLEPQVNILQNAKKDGQIRDESELFSGAHYLSPVLSQEYINELMDSLRAKPNCLVF